MIICIVVKVQTMGGVYRRCGRGTAPAQPAQSAQFKQAIRLEKEDWLLRWPSECWLKAEGEGRRRMAGRRRKKKCVRTKDAWRDEWQSSSVCAAVAPDWIYVSATHNRSAFCGKVLQQTAKLQIELQVASCIFLWSFFLYLASVCVCDFVCVWFFPSIFICGFRLIALWSAVSVDRSLGRHQCSSQRHKLGSIKSSTHTHTDTETHTHTLASWAEQKAARFLHRYAPNMATQRARAGWAERQSEREREKARKRESREQASTCGQAAAAAASASPPKLAMAGVSSSACLSPLPLPSLSHTVGLAGWTCAVFTWLRSMFVCLFVCFFECVSLRLCISVCVCVCASLCVCVCLECARQNLQSPLAAPWTWTALQLQQTHWDNFVLPPFPLPLLKRSWTWTKSTPPPQTANGANGANTRRTHWGDDNEDDDGRRTTDRGNRKENNNKAHNQLGEILLALRAGATKMLRASFAGSKFAHTHTQNTQARLNMIVIVIVIVIIIIIILQEFSLNFCVFR